MAIVERGKGKRKQVFEIVLNGAVLRSQETSAGDKRLPGYRRFHSEAAAASALEAEVRAHLSDHMQPADDEARAIAARVVSVKSGAPALPLRHDLGIYNEATGFVITSRKMAGKHLEEGSPAWNKAVQRGDMLPLTLMQDDPFVIRIVAGEPLSASENEEWVARVDWHLNISDGKLCVTGGAIFTNEDYDPDDDYYEQYVGEVAVPKGRYKASLYTHLHGVNGGGVMDHLAGGYDKGEAIEKWFPRTQPGEPFPDWEGRESVEFLLHLEPVDTVPQEGLSELPEDGWFGGAENARKPARCPLGIEAKDVQRRMDAESGEWTYVYEVFGMLEAKWGKAEPVPLTEGATVALPLGALECAARIAWFASRQTVLELRLRLPPGAAVDLGGVWPQGVIGVQEGSVVRILFSSDLEAKAVWASLRDLAPKLENLPAGTVLDLCAAPLELMPGEPEVAGWLWLRGPVSQGKWTIARALPSVTKAALESALALSAEVAAGHSIAMHDEAEGKAIMDWARRNFRVHLEDNPPRLDKDAITFQQPGHELMLVGIGVFERRFADAWPVRRLSALDDDDDDDDDDDADDGMFPTSPIKGALIYTASGGRAYHQTMALLLSMKIDAGVKAQEKGLRQAGFKEVGDLMCDQFENIAFHAYARGDGAAFAWFRVGYPDSVICEILSFFANGAALITSQNAGIQDDTAANVYRQGYPGASTNELVAYHDRRVAELSSSLGSPTPVTASQKGFAEALDKVILRL